MENFSTITTTRRLLSSVFGYSGERSTHYRYLEQKHQQYLKEYRPMVYSDLILSGKLYSYLSDIDTQARNKLNLLVTQLAEKKGINECLKVQDQLAWVRVMNNIRNRAEEIVLKELIYEEDTV